MSNLIGKSLGRYHLLEKIGEGGMAMVYKALDTVLERHVAIKVILPDSKHSEKFLARFKREAKTLAKLSHPNILKIFDYGEEDNLPYLAMEYIPGGTLKDTLTAKPIHWQKAAQILAPIARALEAAHAQGIVHRDVKPSNILMANGRDPMLSDFGIAKIMESEGETADLTGSGGGIGTPDYMAPEQGVGKPEERSDIYALGVIYYRMVTGRLPFIADTPMAMMLKKTTEPLPRPTQFIPNLPSAVENALIKALARNPRDRYSNSGSFAHVLETLAQGMHPDVPAPRAGLRVGIIGTSILCILGVASIWSIFDRMRRSEDNLKTQPPAEEIAPISSATPREVFQFPSTLTLTPEGSWSGILSARIPTLNEIRADVPPSLWDANLLDVRDILQPGADDYFGEAKRDEEYLFPGYWCATSPDLLVENMENIETTFRVNDEVIPDKYIFSYNYDTNNGWNCTYHAVVLSGWEEGAQYILEIKRILLADLSDGHTFYNAGEYAYRLTVTTR